MSKNISDSRKQQLEELKNFTDAVNKEITDIVRTLDWTMESTMANIVSIIKLLSYTDITTMTELSYLCRTKNISYVHMIHPIN